MVQSQCRLKNIVPVWNGTEIMNYMIRWWKNINDRHHPGPSGTGDYCSAAVGGVGFVKIKEGVMMEIQEKGHYRLLKDFSMRGVNCVGTVPAGKIIEITQIDRQYHKVIGPDFYDWTHWEMPVEKVLQ